MYPNEDVVKLFDSMQKVNSTAMMKRSIGLTLNDILGGQPGVGHPSPVKVGNIHTNAPKSEIPPPKYSDRFTIDLMRRYYKTCMHDNPPETYQLKPAVRIADKVHAAFSRYDPPHDEKKMKKKKEFGKDIETNPEPMVNGSLPLDISDGRIVRNATLAMARYQIWGFAKFAPQQSVFNTVSQYQTN
jgi:hypothetical protein